MTNRLALSVILGATIIALGLGFATGHPAQNRTVFNTVLDIAFPLSILLGAYLIACIWRSGRRK